MSDFINDSNHMVKTDIGMLFLFDIVNSSERASTSENLTNKIFYEKIDVIVKNIIAEINQTYRYNVSSVQNTGDGFYIFSKVPECCLHLWIMLCQQFANEQVGIRCGAAYGKVNLNGTIVGSHLANVVTRCCNYSDDENSLVVTPELYSLIEDSSFFSALSLNVTCVNRPYLKGCTNVEKIFQIKNSKETNIKSNDNNFIFKNEDVFVGRDETLKQCVSIVKDCFSKNKILSIIGISGVGKTTVAICAAKALKYNVVCIDLRQIINLRELHRLLINCLFEELVKENLSKEVFYAGKQTLVNIFSTLNNIAIVFDHAELLSEKKYKEIADFLSVLNQSHTAIILTSTCSQENETVPIYEWLLENPSDTEKVEMLAYWIKAKKNWLISLADKITNHSYLICLIGLRFKGIYKNKKDLICIEDYIDGATDVSNFLKKVIDQLPINIRFWIYLAYLCNGSVFSHAIPVHVLEIYNACGLIKVIGQSAVFHPLVMRTVEAEYSIQELEKIVYNQLCSISDERCKTLTEYYKYLCLSNDDFEEKSKILINNWQCWSEEIDSYKTQALIEKLKTNQNIDKQTVFYDLFLSIIYIFQGDKKDLSIASKKCENLYNNLDNPTILRLLAKIEHIECQRKMYGPSYAIDLLYNDLDIINNMLCEIISDSYIFYGKYYYIGTFFFLIGNILRSIEDHDNAICAYNISLQYIQKENVNLRNAELQKVHIAYGIAESHLKAGRSCLAIELADESLRTIQTTAKFGIALLYLLKARAFLCLSFSVVENYKNALTCVQKAEELFKSIRLPNYIQRCNFVQGAIYTKKKRLSSARKLLVILREHLTETDELTQRVNIMLNHVIGIKGATTNSQVSTITNRKGKQIGLFYYKLSGIENDIPFVTETKTINIQNNQLNRESFFIKMSDLNKNLWLVD